VLYRILLAHSRFEFQTKKDLVESVTLTAIKLLAKLETLAVVLSAQIIKRSKSINLVKKDLRPQIAKAGSESSEATLEIAGR
jgi:hypothetical protein